MYQCACGSKRFKIQTIFSGYTWIEVDPETGDFDIDDSETGDGEFEDMGTVKCLGCGKEFQYSHWPEPEEDHDLSYLAKQAAKYDHEQNLDKED